MEEVLQGALDWAADGSGTVPIGKPPITSVPRASAELEMLPPIPDLVQAPGHAAPQRSP